MLYATYLERKRAGLSGCVWCVCGGVCKIGGESFALSKIFFLTKSIISLTVVAYNSIISNSQLARFRDLLHNI